MKIAARALAAMGTLVMTIGVLAQARTAPRYALEPAAGAWKSWVRDDGLVAPPPPDARHSRAELAEMTRQPDAAAMQEIRYWDAGAPGYRWNQLAYALAETSDIPVERVYALVNVAIYDATIATWRAKAQYARVRPHDAAGTLAPLAYVNGSSSYPSEHAAAAGAAAAVLAYLFPENAASIVTRAEQCGRSRVSARMNYPSDVAAGLALGRAAGARVIDWARKDGSDAKWEGSVPPGAGLWNGKNPENPAIAGWKTWVLRSPDQFRPAAPPAFDQTAIGEVEDPAINTGPHRRAAYAWAVFSLARYWNEQASLRLFEERLDRNPPRAARVYAVLATAYYDALVACWDAKYAYWGIRPNQLDPKFKSLIPTPNFPGYPSGHATFAGVAATVLSGFFPADAQFFNTQAAEAASSRLWAGVHFRVDNEVGLALGRAIGDAALARARAGGGSLTPP